MQYRFYQKKDVRVLLMFIHTYNGILKAIHYRSELNFIILKL